MLVGVFRAGLERLKTDRMLWLLALGAIAFYTPGLVWGLPQATQAALIHGWDVDSVTGIATLSEFHNLFVVAKPDWYVAYPLFHYLLLGLVYTPYLAYMFLTGQIQGPSGVYPFGFTDPVNGLATLTLLGRLVTLGMAVGVVLAAFLTAKRIWGRRAGLVAAVFAGLLGPIVFYSRTGNLDIPLLFWMALGVWMLAKITVQGFSAKRGIALGAFIALSVATKDQAYGAWLPALALLFGLHARKLIRERRLLNVRQWQAHIAIALSGLGFYSLASGLLLSPSRYFEHVKFVLDYENTFYNVVALDLLVPSTLPGYITLLGNISQAVIIAAGPLFLFFALAGLFGGWRENSFIPLLSAMIIGHVLLVIIPVRHMQYRYAIFPAYLLVFFAVQGMGTLIRKVQPTYRWVVFVAIAGALLWLGAASIDLTYQMMVDARKAASTWLYANLEAGDRVAYFGAVDQLPGLPQGILLERLPEDTSASGQLMMQNIDYVLVSPDWSSDAGMAHSRFLDPQVYTHLLDGSIGYIKVAHFRPRSLLGRPLPYLAFVNPPVQIFASEAASDALVP